MNAQIIGIDKLTLTCRDFSVADASSADFGHKKDKRQGMRDDTLPYLLTDERGRDVFAHGIYHNTTQLSLSIDKKHGLGISFNPDKIVHPYHLSEINSAGFTDALSVVDKHLQKIGIRANLDEMKLSRVDLAKQDEMKYNISQYADAFRLLSAKKTMNKRNYLETHTIGNQQHQVSFYDKKHELESMHLKNYITERNLMRCEVRTLRSECTQKVMHSKTLTEFKKLQPADIREIYTSYMQKNIFRGNIESDQLMIDFDREVNLIKKIKQSHSKNLLLMHLASVNLDEYLQMIGGIDNLMKLYADAGCSRAQLYRYKSTIDQIVKLSKLNNTYRNTISVFQLVDDLRYKFVA